MLKRIRFLLPLLIALNVGNAQLFRAIGAKVAYSSAFQEFKFSPFDIDRNRINVVNAAICLDLFDATPIALSVQCEYAQRGVSDRFVLTGSSGPEIIGYADKVGIVRYLSIPVLGKVYFFHGLLSPYVLAGGRIDFMLGHESDDNIFAPVYERFSKTTFGLSGGAGAEFALSPELIALCEARYNFDLKDSYKTDFLRVRNNSIDVWLGVALIM